jgi:hypothetical protein
MMKKALPLLTPATLAALLAIACGEGAPPPKTANPVEEAPATSPPAASSSPTADAGPPASEPSPPVSAADGGGAKPASVESKDECTPVGVDFEKRARPKLKECYAEGKKKNPNLEGKVRIKMTVDVKGKIKSVKVVEKTLPDPVADCMLKVVKATPFPEVEKCWDSTLTIPVTFPTPK